MTCRFFCHLLFTKKLKEFEQKTPLNRGCKLPLVWYISVIYACVEFRVALWDIYLHKK